MACWGNHGGLLEMGCRRSRFIGQHEITWREYTQPVGGLFIWFQLLPTHVIKVSDVPFPPFVALPSTTHKHTFRIITPQDYLSSVLGCGLDRVPFQLS